MFPPNCIIYSISLPINYINPYAIVPQRKIENINFSFMLKCPDNNVKGVCHFEKPIYMFEILTKLKTLED